MFTNIQNKNYDKKKISNTSRFLWLFGRPNCPAKPETGKVEIDKKPNSVENKFLTKEGTGAPLLVR